MTITRSILNPTTLTWALRTLYCAWAAFWAWFVIMASSWESPAPPWWIPAAWLAALLALGFATWRYPLLGGVVLAALGAFSYWYFANSGARALLSLPAIGLGLSFAALAWFRDRPPSP